MSQDSLPDSTRRAVLKSIGAASGVGAAVRVRDRVPRVRGRRRRRVETYPQGNRTAVGFTETVAFGDSVTLSYFVTVGSDPGAGTFGPVEGSADGTEWDAVGGTTDSNLGTGFTV